MKVKKGEWKSWLKTQHSKNDHGIQSHRFMADRRGKSRSSDRFSWASISLPMVSAAMRWEDDCFLEGKLLQSETAY